MKIKIYETLFIIIILIISEEIFNIATVLITMHFINSFLLRTENQHVNSCWLNGFGVMAVIIPLGRLSVYLSTNMSVIK